MSFIKEFKKFALKGNVVDLAVAVIIGAAFGAIITSLVEDVITPLLLTPALKAARAEDLERLTWGTVKYGKFLAAVIKFFLIAVVLFVLIRFFHGWKQKKEEKVTSAPPEFSLEQKLLMEIRDLLKNKQ